MGGGGWFYVPKVWTPAGGWWYPQPHWKRNTAIGYVVAFGLAAAVFNLSRQIERRPYPGLTKVPSQYWAVHDTEPRKE